MAPLQLAFSSVRVASRPKFAPSASSSKPGCAILSRSRVVKVQAIGGGPPPASEERKQPSKALTREAEPEQYWKSKSEAAGANVFQDPLAVIGVAAIFFPFLLLLVAGATGLVDFSVYR